MQRDPSEAQACKTQWKLRVEWNSEKTPDAVSEPTQGTMVSGLMLKELEVCGRLKVTMKTTPQNI